MFCKKRNTKWIRMINEMNGIKKKWTMKSERIVRFCCCCCNFKNESNKIPEQKWEKLNKLFNEIRSKGIGMLGLLKWNYSICSSSQLNWYQEIRSWRLAVQMEIMHGSLKCHIWTPTIQTHWIYPSYGPN